jgi:type II secretory pathway component PulJ
MNSRGVTLVELIIYIVIAAIVVALMAVPFRKMTTSTKTEKQESSLQTNSRDALAVMSREIRNTGFKRYIVDASGTFNIAVIPKTFVTDSSSFILKQGDPSDTLTIYKATIDGSGYSTGGVDSVKYYLSNNSLIRDANTAITELANDVQALQFTQGRLSKDSLLFRADTISSGQWTISGVVSSTAAAGSDLKITYSVAGTAKLTSNNTFSIPNASRVRLVFTLSNNSNVETNIDSLKWSIISSSSGTVVAYDYFKPGVTSGNLIMTCKTAVADAKVQFSAKCKGGDASLTLRLIEVRTADIGSIVWSDTVPTKEKKNIKALRIYTLQRSTSKTESYASGNDTIANIVVPRTSNYAWRLLKETVEIPNNGLF